MYIIKYLGFYNDCLSLQVLNQSEVQGYGAWSITLWTVSLQREYIIKPDKILQLNIIAGIKSTIHEIICDAGTKTKCYGC